MDDVNTDDAQKLWDEVSAARDSGEVLTVETPPANEPAEQTAPAADATPPAAEQHNDATNAPGTDATAQAAAKDPIAELVEKIGKLEGQLRNVNGHIGGLTQGQNALREQVLAAAKQATSQAAGEAPTQAQVKQAMANPAEWDSLKGEFPEWAQATEKLLDARLAGIPQGQQFDQSAIDNMVAQRVAKETAAMQGQLIDAHLNVIVDGDWRQTAQSEDFGKWMAAQPADVQALGASDKLADASKMMRLFVQSKQANPAQQILQQRSARLDAAASVPASRKAPRAKSVEDMTEPELWEHYARQRERQRG